MPLKPFSSTVSDTVPKHICPRSFRRGARPPHLLKTPALLLSTDRAKTFLMLDPDKIKKLDVVTRSALALVAVICALAPLYSPLKIDMRHTEIPLIALFVMMAIAIIYQPRFRNLPPLAIGAIASADLIAYGLVLGTFSYVAAASPRPLVHPILAEIDRTLHFDWPTYYAFVKGNSGLATILSTAYNGMIAEVGIVALVLFLTQEIQRLRVLLDAFALCALITIAVSAVFPALEALAYYEIYPAVVKGAGFVTGVDRTDDFLALHYGTTHIVPVMAAKGIITFPSFHTACAVLSAGCARSRSWLFWPMCLWSALLIAATPVDGGHYLIDVVAGFALSLAVLTMIFTWTRMRERQPNLVLATVE